MAGWDRSALVLESTSAFRDGESWTAELSNAEIMAEGWGETFESAEDDESVGQWLSNIGQGVAAGAATGAVAGPWGALAGGLIGGGLGAAQAAMAQQQPATPRPAPAPTPAPAPPPAPPPRPAPPPPRAPALGPRRPIGRRPVAPPATAMPGEFGQLLDQLAALVPVVAALAVQVGQLAQASAGGPAAGGGVLTLTGEQLGGSPAFEAESGAPESTGELTGWGESAEGPAEAAWVEDASGEWLAVEDRDVDLHGGETEEEPWILQ